MRRNRTLTMRLTNGVLAVEHTIEFAGSVDEPVLVFIEDAIDEMNHKLSVCEQALGEKKEAA